VAKLFLLGGHPTMTAQLTGMIGYIRFSKCLLLRKYYKENKEYFNSKYGPELRHPVRKEYLELFYNEFPRYHPITNPNPAPRHCLDVDPRVKTRLLHDVIREEREADPFCSDIEDE
jgi:hypothetical protein